ncbi:helicase-related protein [Corynebacterium sp. Marseille-P4321]|uniref:helicase-related protein n=1 Tax=Corynebacterium sp. Marseille-P4321 TaxID=2736603 RepID=UPI001589F7B6|nr:helicase-related protein [Corynebacterium sp. Marseille-P4321]
MTLTLNHWYNARESLAAYVGSDLQGEPGETIQGWPLNRMIVGVLHPQQSPEEDHVSLEMEGEEDREYGEIKTQVDGRFTDDFGVSLSNSSLPSSMGLTVAVDSYITSRIDCRFEATRYVRFEDTENRTPVWKPEPLSKTAEILIPRNQTKTLNHTLFDDAERGIRLTAVVRPARDRRVSVTISLVNTNVSIQGERKDALCWFRPRLHLSLAEGSFVEGRPHYEMSHRSEELRELDFLYRNEPNLALGHGCSATWDRDPANVTEISSTYFPTYEVLLADPNRGGTGDPLGEYDLNIGRLAETKDYSELDRVREAYDRWIESQRVLLEQEKSNLNDLEYQIGATNLRKASECSARIAAGVNLLRAKENEDIRHAFRLMNEAMLEQRRDPNQPDLIKHFKWRPFQLAFILMNLPGISDPEHSDRDIADILWFPTGGGKTEAYLGCIAYSIFLRRIRHPEAGGVSAIMRYTLRLLTSDQFDRAAKLICAMEVTRRKKLSHTTAPISLGMWVGHNTTPNTYDDVRKALDNRNQVSAHNINREESLLYQVRKCPQCATSIPFSAYRIENEELLIPCTNPNCAFKDGLPLYFVDEDVYAKHPSLLIGTVDKFALMAWKAEVSELLTSEGDNLAPDLVVQDEFHLLSGPLGTMVGLYESAIDLALTQSGGHKPKIIASTATIRQAAEQTRSIFNRQAFQFPPQGLEPGDNYFSKTAPRDVQGSRRYVGVIAPGTSQATLLIRLYAALLQGTSELQAPEELSPEEWHQVLDTYWTLLGYFNSLRVLGAASLQAVDDIPLRMKAIAQRRGVDVRRGPSETLPSELTSRKNSGEIASTRENMKRKYPDPATPNIILATNMISVGLDIDRLGLMVVAGQPQNASEYIQATSRVGRQHPGLVFVAFNPYRTRDVSHFENFEFFHRTLYSSVEATTATPYSPRARDRGAHGVLVSATRLLIPELRAASSAGSILEQKHRVQSEIVVPLVERAREITGDSAEVSALETRLSSLLDEWVNFANENEHQDQQTEYGRMKDPRTRSRKVTDASLMVQAGTFDGPDRFSERPSWETLTSLRDVDSETHLVLREGGPKNGDRPD